MAIYWWFVVTCRYFVVVFGRLLVIYGRLGSLVVVCGCLCSFLVVCGRSLFY